MIDWMPWLLLSAAATGAYAWRALGVLIAGRVRMDSAFFEWITCVAYAMVAGISLKIIMLPGGALADSAILDRAVGTAVALLVFFVAGRRLLTSLAMGVATFALLAAVRGL